MNLLSRSAAVLFVLASSSAAVGQCDAIWSAASLDGGPSARSHASLEFDEARNELVLIGGKSGSQHFFQTWCYSGGAWTLRSTGGLPVDSFIATCYDSARHRIVAFGGLGVSDRTGATYEWDGANWSLRATTGPSARSASKMAYDAARGVCVLFGGDTSTGLANDTWEWNGSVWQRRSIPGPSARALHMMVYDAARGETILFGGLNLGDPGAFSDTWAYDGQGWSQVGWSGPGPRERALMVYDPVRQAVVLAGGNGLQRGLTDTWIWDGQSWSLASPSAFVGRYHASAAYSPASGGIVCLFGLSNTSAVLSDRVILPSSGTLATVFMPQQLIRPEGAHITLLSAVVPGATYSWRRVPAGLANGTTGSGSVVSGVATSQLSISNAHRDDTGLHLTTIVSPCTRSTSTQLLVILCPADFNADETVDADDLADYITEYFSGISMRPDFNGDGEVNQDDLIDYIAAFFGPCR